MPIDTLDIELLTDELRSLDIGDEWDGLLSVADDAIMGDPGPWDGWNGARNLRELFHELRAAIAAARS
jgi:hypothetical protein